MKTTQVMAMTGENAGQRTYMTKNEQALILRGGMLAGTRGLGHDLSVAQMSSSAALIRAGRSGRPSVSCATGPATGWSAR